MKITRLHLKNVKCLAELDLKVPPGAPVIYVTGPNGAGKTATLDAILFALAGKGKIPAGIVRNGTSRAEIEVTLDDGATIKRTISQGGNAYLLYKRADGTEPASPQGLLNKLVGPITLDPWAFCRATPKERRAMILACAGDPEAIEAADGRYREAYSERTIRKRLLKEAEALKKDAPKLDPDLEGAEPVDLAVLRRRFEEAQDRDLARKRLADSLETSALKIAQLERDLDLERKRHSDLKEALAKEPEADMAGIRKELEAAEELNRRIGENSEALLHRQEVERCKDLVAEAENEVHRADLARKELLAGIAEKLPLNDLGIDEDEVLIREIPFPQLSTAQQLKVAVAISTASDPELRIIRITDGSLLDSASRAFLDEIARQLDLQIWVEDVRETGEAGIEITTE